MCALPEVAVLSETFKVYAVVPFFVSDATAGQLQRHNKNQIMSGMSGIRTDYHEAAVCIGKG
jgi:hypothetical protein